MEWIKTAREAGAKCALVVFLNAEEAAQKNIRDIEQCRLGQYLEKFRKSIGEVVTEGWDLIMPLHEHERKKPSFSLHINFDV